MDLGWKIFAHALAMVLANVPAIIRIFWAPTALSIAVIGSFLYLSGMSDYLVWGETVTVPQENTPDFIFAWFFLIWIMTAIIGAWGVTTWHRYILLEEFTSGFIPRFDIKLAVGYVLRLFLLGIIFLAIAIPTGFVLMNVAQVTWPVALAGLVFVLVLVGIVFLRWSLVLPAFAVDKAMGLSEGWNAWSRIHNPGRTALGLIFFYVMFQLIVSFAINLLQFIPPIHGILSLAFQVFLAILNISILTTVYGYVVEKRELT